MVDESFFPITDASGRDVPAVVAARLRRLESENQAVSAELAALERRRLQLTTLSLQQQGAHEALTALLASLTEV